MGEKQGTDQRSPSTGKRPSPTSVKELLDIVHLQQTTVPLNVTVKQGTEVLSTRGGFNPLPAIGRSACSHPPPTRSTSPPHQVLQTTNEFARTRANSDGNRYSGSLKDRYSGLSSSAENGSAMPSIHTPRDGPNHPVPSTPAGRPTQQRRERILPPLSELKSEERSQSRLKRLEVYHSKTPLRRTASGDSEVRISSVDNPSNHGHQEERMQRPKSSHGRRRPLPSEIVAIHNSTPAPYGDGEVFSPSDTRQSGNSANLSRELSPRNPPRSQNPAPPSLQRLERPKSTKGRTRRRIRTTGSLSQGDDWSSDEDVRPRAPSPPSPGLDSDLDSGNECYDVSNGRNVRPR